ncbi:MAG: helix-turn-helix domain-containing protein [Pseudomonadota bacterium]
MTTFSLVLAIVSEHFGVSREVILSKDRHAQYVLPRHVAMYLLRTRYGYSFPRLGRYFHRDHTSVMYAVEQVANMTMDNQSDQEWLDEIRSTILRVRRNEKETPFFKSRS